MDICLQISFLDELIPDILQLLSFYGAPNKEVIGYRKRG